jgi:hypothetical protein
MEWLPDHNATQQRHHQQDRQKQDSRSARKCRARGVPKASRGIFDLLKSSNRQESCQHNGKSVYQPAKPKPAKTSPAKRAVILEAGTAGPLRNPVDEEVEGGSQSLEPFPRKSAAAGKHASRILPTMSQFTSQDQADPHRLAALGVRHHSHPQAAS